MSPVPSIETYDGADRLAILNDFEAIVRDYADLRIARELSICLYYQSSEVEVNRRMRFLWKRTAGA